LLAATAVALTFAGLLLARQQAPLQAAPAEVPPPALTYQLAATWANVPWQLRAGHYADIRDVSSAPDGTRYVLDESSGLGARKALHVLDRSGTPVAVLSLTLPGCQPTRLDVGNDGVLLLLNRCGGAYRVARLDSTGQVLGSFDVATSGQIEATISDIAAAPDGSVVLSGFDKYGDGPFLRWYSPTGAVLETIDVPQRLGPTCVDVGADGRVYTCIKTCPPPPDPESPPTPSPTPRPSVADPGRNGANAVDAVAPVQATGWGGGLVVLSARHQVEATYSQAPLYDVAAGATDAYAAVHDGLGSIVRVDGWREVFQVPRARPMNEGGFGYSPWDISMDVTADGQVVAAYDQCTFKGTITLADPSAWPAAASYAGEPDHPALRGPSYPIRLAAGDELVALEGAFGTAVSGLVWAPSSGWWPSAQRWALDGSLIGQLTFCRLDSGIEGVADIARDGADSYVLAAQSVWMRPDPLMPAWNYESSRAPNGRLPQFVAAAADGGRVAVLDIGGGRVLVLNRSGAKLAEWPLDEASPNTLPVDIALSGDRIYLADLGRDRILVRGLDGADLGAWPVHDGPQRLAAGPDGDLFVLGRGRNGLRYNQAGELVAWWPLADRTREATDIAADAAGQVYISHLRRQPLSNYSVDRIVDAGIWVYQSGTAAVDAPSVPPTHACLTSVNKTAAPGRVQLGDSVVVRLQVEGACPGQYDLSQLMILMDTSGSMAWDDALLRAKRSLLPMLDALNPDALDVGLVTFDTGGALQVPLSRDIRSLRAKIGEMGPDGDTHLAAGLELARLELTGPRRKPESTPVIWLVTDGVFKDAPQAAVDAARRDGIEIYALVYPTAEFGGQHLIALETLLGGRDHVMLDLDPALDATLVNRVTRYRPEPRLFDTLHIMDRLPDNMVLEPESMQPPAVVGAGGVLTWDLIDVPSAGGVTLSYRVRPQEVGLWPTNVEALATYVDALGANGRLPFPVPTVEVLPRPTPTPAPQSHTIYLPILQLRHCVYGRDPLDIVLAIDASSSMNESAGDGRSKLEAARESAIILLGFLRPGDRAALVSFHSLATTVVPLTGDHRALVSGVGSFTSGVGTRLDLALSEADRELERNGRGARQALVLLTDGLQDGGNTGVVLAAADRLKRHGAEIDTVGLGPRVDAALLAGVASSPVRYHPSANPRELHAVYESISLGLVCR
jgi:Mg-chelatase subunit ChlD